jgi:isopenicillin N synthase-like dioxygenase
MLSVPVVDMERADAGKALGDAFEHTGFAVIVNHGVDLSLVEAAYAGAREFFAQPMQSKRRYTAPEKTKGRGYLPLGIESVAATLSGRTPPDLCEALVFASIQRERAGAGLPNFWPDQPAALAGCVNAYFDAMLGLCRRLMQLSALALELPRDHFEPFYRHPSLTLRFVNYPDQPEPPQAGQLRYGAHHDYGGLTILRQDEAPGGLQIGDAEGGWHDVPPHPGSFVINVGDLMSRWTNGRWRSTLHRVINPARELTGSTQRLSMVAFTGPAGDTQVECLPSCIGEGRPARFEPVNAQAYVLGKIAASHDLG